MKDGVVNRGGQRRYSYMLRPIGAYLDSVDARYATIAEIEDGFIWQCMKLGDPTTLMSGTVSLEDLPALVDSVKHNKDARARAHEARLRAERASRGLFRRQTGTLTDAGALPNPVCPYGYEETLRSLGAKLEDQRAYMILLIERHKSMVVRYSLPLPTYIRVDLSRMETFTGFHEVEYPAEELTAIVEQVRERRGIPYYQ